MRTRSGHTSNKYLYRTRGGHTSRKYVYRTLAAMLTIGLITCNQASALGGQAGDADDRTRAYTLYQENKLTDALPLLEKLLAAKPDDTVLLERTAHCLLAYSITLSEPARKREALARAHKLAEHASELGDNSNLIQLLLKIPADGSSSSESFSSRKGADEALLEGDKALSRGDFQTAIKGYKRALELDPNLYQAPLFMGDAYFKMNQPDEAGKWYAYAIKMQPDKETAYRYWGDVLARGGKMAEARSKLIEAIVAEPYNRATWAGLGQWARRAGVRIAPPQIPIPDFKRGADGKAAITLDPANTGSVSWIVYAGVRTNWADGNLFREAYPNEKEYRHSLREETEALKAAVDAASKTGKAGGTTTLEPGLQILIKLAAGGLIESYVLLSRADQGIAQDYAAYRAAHREKLNEYLSQYVVPGVK